MDITYLGHSSFRIKGKHASIISDPFDPKMVGLKYPKNSADIVTISHQHNDHNFTEGVGDVKKIIDGPGEYEIMGVSFIGFSTFHDEEKGAQRGKNTIYVMEIEDLRVVHLGDIGHVLTGEMIEALGEIDILMIPVGGFYTVDAEKAAKIVNDTEASIVIPMHYKVSGLNPEISDKLSSVDDFLTVSGLPVEKMDKLSIKKSDIVEDAQKVIVLEKKV